MCTAGIFLKIVHFKKEKAFLIAYFKKKSQEIPWSTVSPDPTNSKVQCSQEFPTEALGTLQDGAAQMREQQGAHPLI